MKVRSPPGLLACFPSLSGVPGTICREEAARPTVDEALEADPIVHPLGPSFLPFVRRRPFAVWHVRLDVGARDPHRIHPQGLRDPCRPAALHGRVLGRHGPAGRHRLDPGQPVVLLAARRRLVRVALHAVRLAGPGLSDRRTADALPAVSARSMWKAHSCVDLPCSPSLRSPSAPPSVPDHPRHAPPQVPAQPRRARRLHPVRGHHGRHGRQLLREPHRHPGCALSPSPAPSLARLPASARPSKSLTPSCVRPRQRSSSRSASSAA